MKTLLSILLELNLCVLFVSCGISSDTLFLEPDTKIQLKSFYVLSPSESNWHYTTDVKNENLLLWRGVSENVGMSDLVVTDPSQDYEEMIIYTNIVSPAIDSLNISENYIFNHHIKYWLESVNAKYEQSGYGKFTEISRDSTTIDDKRLWVINYYIYNCSVYGLMRNGIGIKYLYFPGNFKADKIFYSFIYEVYPSKTENADIKYLNDKNISHMIRSFVCKEN